MLTLKFSDQFFCGLALADSQSVFTWLGSGPDVALRELELESLVNPIFV
jgi:hypothetical protein